MQSMPQTIESPTLGVVCALLCAFSIALPVRASSPQSQPTVAASSAFTLSAEVRATLVKPVATRRPATPPLWPVTPTAGYGNWSKTTGSTWMAEHEKLIATAQTMRDADIVLLGDALLNDWVQSGPANEKIRASWASRWEKNKTLNLSLGSEKVEYLLWRFTHGAIDGLAPRVVVLSIGLNNIPQIQRDGVPPAAIAEGISLCLKAVRSKAPKAAVIIVKLPPAGSPTSQVRVGIQAVNAHLDSLKLDADPQVTVVDLTPVLTNSDGTLLDKLYVYRHLRLEPAGYEAFAQQLQTPMRNALAVSN